MSAIEETTGSCFRQKMGPFKQSYTYIYIYILRDILGWIGIDSFQGVDNQMYKKSKNEMATVGWWGYSGIDGFFF